jgi:hypothetical protein
VKAALQAVCDSFFDWREALAEPAEPWQCSWSVLVQVAGSSRKDAKAQRRENRRFSVGIRAIKKKTLRLGVFARES